MFRWLALGSTAWLLGCTTPLAEFEHTLAAQDSATAVLGQWCATKALAEPPTIRAERIRHYEPPGAAEVRKILEAGIREQLDVDDNQSVEYRHVRLTCGNRVLSEAHNWYVPSRLTTEMNEMLETGDTPFGKVVAPLGFTRKRLESTRGAMGGCPKDTVLSHRALLELPDGRPLSLVVECYTAANLP